MTAKPKKPKNFKYGTDQTSFYLEEKKMSLEAGWLGKVFGCSENARTNITGLIVVFIILAGCIISFWPRESLPAVEYWKTVSPIIMGVLGYFFGKN